MRRFCAFVAAASLGLGAAQAQARFPNKPVRIVVPFPAGGTADLLPRIVGEKLAKKWGEAVIIENRAGAGGNIGADAVARSEPDGYTLLASPPGPLAINQNLYARLSYDPRRFAPITILATVPNVLAARTGLAAASVKDVIALAKAAPNRLSFASQGNGSTSHLTASLFESMAGVKMLHVPYKGTAPALTDLIAGRVDIFFDNLGSTRKPYEAGRIKILAVAGAQRARALPGVPTVAEAGLPGFVSVTWFGVVAPEGTPRAIAEQLGAAFNEALELPDVQKRFLELGAEPKGGTPAETAAFIREETERWHKVIKSANVTLN